MVLWALLAVPLFLVVSPPSASSNAITATGNMQRRPGCAVGVLAPPAAGAPRSSAACHTFPHTLKHPCRSPSWCMASIPYSAGATAIYLVSALNGRLAMLACQPLAARPPARLSLSLPTRPAPPAPGPHMSTLSASCCCDHSVPRRPVNVL